MPLSRIPKLIQWWVTPKLPKEHIFIAPEERPKELAKILNVYFRKWLIHPIKRRIAKYYLIILQKVFKITVIGITGSVGKTTTKEMVVSILRQKGESVCSYANIDPVYNIPTAILKCRPKTRYLVLEMGVEFVGEMDYYLWLARPLVGVLMNIYPTHTLFFKNTTGVAREKSKLIKALPRNGFAILNKENTSTKKIAKLSKARVIYFGKTGETYPENISLAKDLGNKFTLVIGTDKINVHLPVPGLQFVSNSLAAASVGLVCGVSLEKIKAGLDNFSWPEHRMRPIRLVSGALLIDDTYNSNPAAVKEALKTLNQIGGKRGKIIVLGDMLELGRHEEKFHKEIGSLVASYHPDYLIGVGKAAKAIIKAASKTMKDYQLYWTQTYRGVASILQPLLKKNVIILIKGSRSMALDKVVSQLS